MAIEPTVFEDISFVSEVKQVNDLIFSTRNYANKETSGLDVAITDDNHYTEPDYKQYLFSTMGKGISAVHHNNMVTAVRSKPSLTSAYMHGVLSNYIKESGRLTYGVYIINEYAIYNDGNNDIASMLNHYTTSVQLDLDDDTIISILSQAQMLEGTRLPYKITFRIVTFIPEAYINTYSYIYSKNANLLIAKGDLHDCMHPHSKGYKDQGYQTDELVKNNISIEIVDNESNKPYYIKVGKDVVTLFPTADNTRHNGVVMNYRRNNADIGEAKSTLVDINSIGVYKTQEEAYAEGDLKLSHERDKLLHERDKLRMDKDKLSYDYKKLEVDYNKLEAENTKLRYETDTVIRKNRHELLLGEMKLNNELKLGEMKRTNELSSGEMKLRHELSTFTLKETATIHREMISLKKAALDMTRQELAYERTLEMDNIKRSDLYAQSFINSNRSIADGYYREQDREFKHEEHNNKMHKDYINMTMGVITKFM